MEIITELAISFSPATRLMLGGLLLWAGLSKWDDRSQFGMLIAEYDVVPRRLAAYLGQTLPGVEITLAILLLLGAMTRYANGLAAGLLVIYTSALVFALKREKSVGCQCFGKSERTISWWSVYRNTGLLLLTLPLSLATHYPLSLDALTGETPSATHTSVAGMLTGSFLLLTLSLTWILIGQIGQVRRQTMT